MSTQTLTQYADKLKSFAEELQKNNRPFAKAVQSTVVRQANRIFVDGKKSDGSLIGQYDTTKPMYVNPDKSTGAVTGARGKGFKIQGLKPTKGKDGEHLFKNGKAHKTTYLNNYKDFRNRIGKRIDKVNLNLSGSLFFDFINGNTVKEAKAHKIDSNHYEVALKNVTNQLIMEGHNEKYGKISDLTPDEFNGLTRISLSELILDLKRGGLA